MPTDTILRLGYRLALVASVSAFAALASAAAGGRPRLEAGVLSGPIRIDGVLDEADWSAAPAASDLTMVEPREGDPATGRTVVKVLAGPTALVFGMRCEDPDATRIVSFTKERDGVLDSEDHVTLLLDPFQDGRSGYVFAVNPGGARVDSLVNPGGGSVDTNWDGEWEAATTRDGGGWTAEIRIPIQTLGFKRGLHEWGFNVERRIQRLQETDRWANASQNAQVYQSSQLSGRATWWFGGFHSGTLHQIEAQAAWTPSPLVTLLVDAEHDIGRLAEGDFDLTLIGTKIRLNLSPDLQVNSFVQYDTADQTLGTNTRLRWTFSPRGDLFVIYNHNLREVESRWRRESNQLLLKVQYTFRP